VAPVPVTGAVTGISAKAQMTRISKKIFGCVAANQNVPIFNLKMRNQKRFVPLKKKTQKSFIEM